MSTSLLYHGFGIRGYAYVRTEYRHGQVFFTIRQGGDTLRCAACGARGGSWARFSRCWPVGACLLSGRRQTSAATTGVHKNCPATTYFLRREAQYHRRGRLNGRVRKGNGCGPPALVTGQNSIRRFKAGPPRFGGGPSASHR